ncbi:MULTISPECIES: DUF986 family protein [Yersiniaceae]|uniref:UPF0266 membrane protein JK232_13735 n=1 Tax=Nissabacter archeti TaxID=1917880 RepID=A0ABS5JJ84_9GAMM|nr:MULTISPECIES: DUF986 family protein [Yersiniaceae]MBS0969957.1 DUF986 domain-containing protein [Nissabacter archeti]MDV5139995.1 DUF986 family protein [Chimaeribacter arupi]PLR51334.1 DUF986 domain-containing protein [Chimaeribacter arupi]
MTLTEGLLLGCIVVVLAYAIYLEWILPRRNGKTLLRVNLLRKGRADSLIFIALLGIVIYQHYTGRGAPLTLYLLTFLLISVCYISFIRRPVLLFKPEGFYYGNLFIAYTRIRRLHLSEEGVLFIHLEQRKLPIHVQYIGDLDNIKNILFKNQEDGIKAIL